VVERSATTGKLLRSTAPGKGAGEASFRDCALRSGVPPGREILFGLYRWFRFAHHRL